MKKSKSQNISSRDISRSSGREHGFVLNVARKMKDEGLISFFEGKYQHNQNKCIYNEYWFDSSNSKALSEKLKRRKALNIKKKKIPTNTRIAVFVRDKQQCCICGCKDNLCLDHIVPESRGGTHELDNLQILCRSCNSKKGTKTMKEFNEYLKRLAV